MPIFLFSRSVDNGAPAGARQVLTVFAADRVEAHSVIRREFAGLQKDSDLLEPIYHPQGDWQVSEIDLDGPKIVTMVIT